MATIDIDLDEFDFDDLIKEVTDRLNYEKHLSDYESKLLIALAKQIGTSLTMDLLPNFPSLADEMKAEFAGELMEKYSEAQLREMADQYEFKNQKSPV